MGFTHLHTHSNFSFLDSGSSVKTLLDQAKAVGCESLALTDHDGLYGAVRFYEYAHKIGIKPIIGTEIKLEDDSHLVLLARNMQGYSNLCKIITRAHLSHEKGKAAASLDVISEFSDNIFCLSGCEKGEVTSLVRAGNLVDAENAAAKYMEIFGRDSFLIELQNHMLPSTGLVNSQLNDIASRLGLRTVATNNVHYATKDDFKIQDVLVCVRTLTTLDQQSPDRKRNAEYYLKSPQAMANLFTKYPKAVAATDWIAAQCNLDLGLGMFRFPGFPVPDGETAYSHLCKICYEALDRLYHPITPKVTERLQHELKIINDLGFPEYFLAVWDIVNYARSNGIRCSGRGSAADSIVAYCLGVTIADPIAHNLLFERFLNPERKGMPDIDIDFDAARRDEVINYIYQHYGEDKVAMVCTVSTLKARSSIRDIGKAMDFAPDDIGALASVLPHVGAKRIREAVETLPELRKSNLPIQKLEALIDICEKVDDFPRHLSVHLCGVVVSRELLTELVPLEWATKGMIVSQYDKDDIETLGLVKMDILGLRNLSAIEDCLAILKSRGIELDIDNIPLDDEPTFEMLRTTKTLGCFQVESPGMRGLLARLQPRIFEDIIAQISLFRPGPMQADMINPFIARRHGLEEVSYSHPSLEPALGETYGVILYQEQVLSVSHALAGFTYGQADSLRRAMTNGRGQDEMEKIKEGFLDGARRNGVASKVADEVFSKLRAFAAYGFCKAHAASFAVITYQTAYLKAHYPAEFMAGILCNEPMGFYPANVIIEEARRLGIRILNVDVNASEKKYTVEYDENGKSGIRIALSQVKGISGAEVDSIVSSRQKLHSKAFSSFGDFKRRTNCDKATIENLINCGAFDSLGISMEKLLWLSGEPQSNADKNNGNTGFEDLIPEFSEPDMDFKTCELEPMSIRDRVRVDYDILGLSSICHSMVFYRDKLTKARIFAANDLLNLPNNTIVRVAGVAVVCMRPPTRSGTVVVFITLEDETGVADFVVFPTVYEQYGKVIYGNTALILEGKLQRIGEYGVSIVVRKVYPLTKNYLDDDIDDLKPFKEKIRSAGTRSFVRATGV